MTHEPGSTPDAARHADAEVRAAYDRVPYPAGSQHHTHPDRLATLAVLHGLEPAPPEACRLLELACADGGNLVAMAHDLPESRFEGVDLSPRQIADGRCRVEALGLGNVELRQASLLDLDPEEDGGAAYDYVIAHGVYSWVSEPVRERILALARGRLRPHGVAYVSYNTYPGWHLKGALREMMLHHVRGVTDPGEKVGRALDLLDLLADAAGAVREGEAWHALLASARDDLGEYRERPSYLLHEYLERDNHPVWFRELAERAERHGLQYLGDAEAKTMQVDNLGPELAERLRAVAADRLELEQYLDFATNRAFRRTLLCRRERRLVPGPDAARMRRLWAASPVAPAETGGSNGDERRTTFRGPETAPFSTTHPLARAVLLHLGRLWPRAIRFDEILAEARSVREEAEAARAEEVTPEALADLLHALFFHGVLELHVTPPRCVETPGERPRASELARRQAAEGPLVTSQRHRVLRMDDEAARLLLRHLDGTHDRAALAELLVDEVRAGRLQLTADETPILADAPRERLLPVLAALVDQHLEQMARVALLVG
jgi:methyltransferase-like protein